MHDLNITNLNTIGVVICGPLQFSQDALDAANKFELTNKNEKVLFSMEIFHS